MIDYVQILDHLSIGAAVLDHSLGIVFWNQWMVEHSHITKEESTGIPLTKLFPALVKKDFIRKARKVFQTGQPVFFTHKVHHFLFPFFTPRSYLGRELHQMQQTVILSPVKDEAGDTQYLLLTIFDISDWVDYQNQLLESQRALEKLSQTDELTQISNRRDIMEKLKVELSIHLRKKRGMALIMIDLDHFKRVNDEFGHLCGDHILYETAAVLAESLRQYDTVGRYGGEEFIMILPETNSQQALVVGERIRARIENHRFSYKGQEIRLTLSLGLSLKRDEETVSADQLLAMADRCLYQAKEKGRNQVVMQNV